MDYIFLEINDAFEKQTGLKNAIGKRMRELAPRHEQHWFDIYGQIALTKGGRTDEWHGVESDGVHGSKFWIQLNIAT